MPIAIHARIRGSAAMISERALRIQFTVGDTLVAEAIVEGWEERDKLCSDYFLLKSIRGLPLGSSFTSRTNIRRYNVSVGSEIR